MISIGAFKKQTQVRVLFLGTFSPDTNQATVLHVAKSSDCIGPARFLNFP